MAEKRLECYLEQLSKCRKEHKKGEEILSICEVIVKDADKFSGELTLKQKKDIAWSRNYLQTNMRMKTNLLRARIAEMKRYREDISNIRIREKELSSICRVVVENTDSLIENELFNPTLEDREEIDWARNYLNQIAK